MATGTAVSAGTFGQSTSSLAGSSGYGFRFSGVTLTGTGIIYQRGRIEAKDAARFKNQTASFSCKVYQDTGGAINFTVYIRKANSADNFAAVTAIGNSGAVSIPDSTDTALKYEVISMRDCSAGIEYEIKGEVGAITTKNIYISEIQLEIGSVATAFESKKFVDEFTACQRYTASMGGAGATIYVVPYGIISSPYLVFPVIFKTRMRAIPTISSSSPAFVTTYPVGNQIAAYNRVQNQFIVPTTTVSIGDSAPSQDFSSIVLTASTSWTGTAGEACYLIVGSTAIFIFSAEL
jgi:hypothetical protein